MLALGYLQWPPSEFWAATPRDFYDAMEGFNEKNGASKDQLPDDDYADLANMLED